MKTNVLIIQESMTGGGAERVLATILNNFDRSRFNITLLLIYKTGVLLDSIPDDIEVLNIFADMQVLSTRIINHFYKIRNFFRELSVRRIIGKRRFDVVISFMEGSVAKLHSQLFDLAPRHLSWVHTDLKTGRWYDFWFKEKEEREFYKHIDKVAFVSIGAREVFKTMFETKACLDIIYNPIDKQEIVRKSEECEKETDNLFTIINVGRLTELKRQDRLILAARILKDRGHRFRINILGSGDLENDLKTLSLKTGTDDCVNFIGFVKNPYPWMRNADVFCLTSQAEGFALVVAESMILRVPVVTTRITGPMELLSGGGGIFTSEDPEDIADKLETLMTHPDELARLKAETASCANQFNLENVMERIYDFILK